MILGFRVIEFYTYPTPVIQIMISQVIIGYRTWAITRRSKEVGLFLLGLGLIVTTLQWYANVDGRIPVQDEVSFFRPHVSAPVISATDKKLFSSQGEVSAFICSCCQVAMLI